MVGIGLADDIKEPMTHEADNMADEKPAITRDVLIAFIATRFKGAGACPTCDTNDWELVNTIDSEVGVPVFSDGSQIVAQFPIFALFCSNCGYTQMHMRSVVETWMSENKDEFSLKPLEQK